MKTFAELIQEVKNNPNAEIGIAIFRMGLRNQREETINKVAELLATLAIACVAFGVDDVESLFEKVDAKLDKS